MKSAEDTSDITSDAVWNFQTDHTFSADNWERDLEPHLNILVSVSSILEFHQ